MLRRGFHLLVLFMALVFQSDSLRAAEKSQEAYDAIYISGVRVGHMTTLVEKVSDRGKPYIRVQVDLTMNFKRDKDALTMQVRYGTIETPEGDVLRLDCRTLASQQELRVHGDVIQGKMLLKIANGAQRQEMEIPWRKEYRGPHGVEQSLTKTPMKAGERREVYIFIPELNKVAQTRLIAKDLEPVSLGGGVKRDLLRIDSETFDEGKSIPGMNPTYWVDETGQVLKQFTDSFGGTEFFRTTKAGARSTAPARLDLNAAQIVKVARKINNPELTKEVVYKVTVRGDDPAKIFVTDSRQSFTPNGENSGLLVVKAIGPDEGEVGPETVGDEFLRSNPLITSNDEKVGNLARAATKNQLDAWSKAKAINSWVARNLRDKNFETSFAPADEVARTLSGDCTEHAVLVAAMCRAVGIPARVATGMIYVDQRNGFGFHMWDEVYIGRRWIAIDSAFDQAPIDAVHLKFSDSSLDGVAPFEALQPVVRAFGKTSIEPLEVR